MTSATRDEEARLEALLGKPAPASTLATRLAKDEDGAIMVLTLIMMMVLVKACFSVFNVGALAAEKIRLQVATDTAAYSSAVWQARFLNYSAYTRRAIIANYANVALFTAMESNKEGWDYYDEENPKTWISCPPNPLTIENDNGDDIPVIPTPRNSMNWFGPGYDFSAGQFSDNDDARKTAESLAKIYSTSQQVMYYYSAAPWFTIAPKIVEAANQSVNVGGETVSLPQIDIDPDYQLAMTGLFAANRSGMLNGSFVERRGLEELQEDVEKRFCVFTQPRSNFLPLSLPYFVSRPFHAYDPITWLTTKPATCTGIMCINPYDEGRTTVYWTNSAEMDMDLSGGSVETGDSLMPWNIGQYFMGWQTIITKAGCVEVPGFATIIDFQQWDADYSLKYDSDELEFYDMTDDARDDATRWEPSVYMALRIKREELVDDTGATKRLFEKPGLRIARAVRNMTAVSRAKVYFQPRYDTSMYRPDLYYPYWDAKLAPIYGPGMLNAPNTLRINSTATLGAASGVNPFGTALLDYYNKVKH